MTSPVRPPIKRLALATLALLVTGGCGLGDNEARADRIVASARAASTAPTTAGAIRVSVTPIVPKELSALAVVGTVSPSTAEARFVVEGGRRSAITPAAEKPFPVVVFSDRRIALRRPEAAPEDARPWIDLTLADLERGSGRVEALDAGLAAGILAVLDPRIVLDLAAGALAGSIEPVAGTAPDSVSAFEANFDLEKMLTDTRDDAYTDERADQVRLLLEMLRVSEDPHPGRIELDDDGTLRSFDIALAAGINRALRFTIGIEVDVEPSPDSAAVDAPPPSATVRTRSLMPLVRAAGLGAGGG